MSYEIILVDDGSMDGSPHIINSIKKFGGKVEKGDKYIQPTLLTNVNKNMKVMQDEIFGPILPVITYKNKEEVVELLNTYPSPLALYIMSNKKETIDYFLNNTLLKG